MLSRRSFLISTGAVALGQLLSGCGDSEHDLRVFLLQGSIPPQLLTAFRQQLSPRPSLSFTPQAQLKMLFELLATWQGKDAKKAGLWRDLPKIPIINPQEPPISDLVTLGDAWLAEGIQQGLIDPLELTDIPNWQKLPSRWQRLVKRDGRGNVKENGQIWGAPYRWGTTLMVYQEDKLDWEPTDWSDLWDERLRDRITLVDQPREVIGLTLKKLGQSYNTQDLASVPGLKSELLSLQKQVKYYSSRHYLQPLLIGDAWLSVGWSNEILPLIAKNRGLKAIIPASGTSLWSDIWVKPKAKTGNVVLSKSAKQWIDFCWQPQAADLISLFTEGASPMINVIDKNELSKEVQDNPLLLIKPEIFDKCEFLEPLPDKVQAEYLNLWKEMRNS
ncbi:extracellular solute-binding protein [Crocosphaera sp. XPORK-15E]|uniref:extracellular solute-binding protein n=1 Tax=Crocosphaera sp. XPORK-15E TaxID=3110247 RepID=UPI002B1ED84E|nr:extracellular solute-binding protein [Crocosphaera sp. XPORK-15E]MEA5532907.1 extracellular solute-binding protein [Crocosphaera sp. XPORK-15E]